MFLTFLIRMPYSMASHACQVHRVTPLDLLVMRITVIILNHRPLHHVLYIGLVTIHLHFLLLGTGVGPILRLEWRNTHLHHLGDQVKLLYSLTLSLIHPVEEAILKQSGHLLPVYPVLVSVHHAPLSSLLFLPQIPM